MTIDQQVAAVQAAMKDCKRSFIYRGFHPEHLPDTELAITYGQAEALLADHKARGERIAEMMQTLKIGFGGPAPTFDEQCCYIEMAYEELVAHRDRITQERDALRAFAQAVKKAISRYINDQGWHEFMRRLSKDIWDIGVTHGLWDSREAIDAARETKG